jgi:hypothetical protein
VNRGYDANRGNYGRSLTVDEFDGDVIEYAGSVFAEYRSRGIMLNDSFDDDA